MMDIIKLKAEQTNLAKILIIKDDFNADDIKTAGGINQGFTKKDIVSAIVVCDYKNMDVVEKQCAIEEAKMPYISGFRAYREGAAVTSAYAKLSTKPDILMFHGHGILHPRKIGIASHMGLLLNQPSIGVASTISCGVLKNNKIYIEEKIAGELVETRKHSKPVYVSPGHRISLKTSVEIAKNCMRPPHKLPEPLYLSHKYLKEVMREISINKKQ